MQITMLHTRIRAPRIFLKLNHVIIFEQSEEKNVLSNKMYSLTQCPEVIVALKREA